MHQGVCLSCYPTRYDNKAHTYIYMYSPIHVIEWNCETPYQNGLPKNCERICWLYKKLTIFSVKRTPGMFILQDTVGYNYRHLPVTTTRFTMAAAGLDPELQLHCFSCIIIMTKLWFLFLWISINMYAGISCIIMMKLWFLFLWISINMHACISCIIKMKLWFLFLWISINMHDYIHTLWYIHDKLPHITNQLCPHLNSLLIFNYLAVLK